MRYKCEPGFTVVGRKSILCQADGTWTRSELPTCIPVQCKVGDGYCSDIVLMPCYRFPIALSTAR